MGGRDPTFGPFMAPELTLSAAEVEAVHAALVSRPDWLSLARALEDPANSLDSASLKRLSEAFTYDLVDPSQNARRSTAGGPYATMFESEAGAYPPRPGDVDAEVQAFWKAAAEQFEDPIVGARLNDLQYVAQGKSAHVQGRAAAGSLVALAETEAWTALERAVCLARALEILRELNDGTKLGVASTVGVTLVRELANQEHPGPPMAVFRALMASGPKRRPPEIDALADLLVERYADTPAHPGILALAAEATADPQRRQALRVRQLDERIREARAAEGLVKVSFLQRAIDFARRHGFTEEADKLLREQQELPRDDLGFETITESVELPTEAVRIEVDRVVGSGAADLFVALEQLGSLPPPGESAEAIEEEVEEATRLSPVANLFGHQLFSREASTPNFIANSDEDKRALARGQAWGRHASFWGGVLLGPMLVEARERHGQPDRDALAAHFATEVIGEERGERIARSFQLFWDEEFDDSAHVLVSRLEAILRDVARRSDITIVKPAQEGRFAGVISLNQIMDKLLELTGDAPWLSYLRALLCDPLAVNLRNDIAHGLAGRVGPVQAALLLQAACFLQTLRVAPPAADAATA
jgi:hypothetical protein